MKQAIAKLVWSGLQCVLIGALVMVGFRIVEHTIEPPETRVLICFAKDVSLKSCQTIEQLMKDKS